MRPLDVLITVALASAIAAAIFAVPNLLRRVRERPRATHPDHSPGVAHVLIWIGIALAYVVLPHITIEGKAYTTEEFLLCPVVGAAVGGLLLWALRRWWNIGFPLYPGDFLLAVLGAQIVAHMVDDLLLFCWARGVVPFAFVAAVANGGLSLWAAHRARGTLWKCFFVFSAAAGAYQFLGRYILGWTRLEQSLWFLPTKRSWDGMLPVVVIAALTMNLAPGRQYRWTHWLGISVFLYLNVLVNAQLALMRPDAQYLPIADLMCGLLLAVLAMALTFWNGTPEADDSGSKAATPWYYFGTMAMSFSHIAIVGREQNNPGFVFFVAALAVWAFARMVAGLCQRRRQFSLRSLHLTFLMVALLCSASYYFSVVPLLVILGWIPVTWTKLSEMSPTGRSSHSDLRPSRFA